MDTPGYAPPPLSRWSSTWRYLVAAIPALVAVVMMGHPDRADIQSLTAVKVGVEVGGFVFGMALLTQRRRWPVAVNVIYALLGSVSLSAFGPACVAYTSLATRRRWRPLLVVGALSVALTQLHLVIWPDLPRVTWWEDLAWTVLVFVALTEVGFSIAIRRELAATPRTASPHQPPARDSVATLSWWSSTWRYLAALGFAVLALGSTIFEHLKPDQPPPNIQTNVELLCLAGGMLLLPLRRRWPLQVNLAYAVLGIFSVSAIGPGCVALVSLATRRRWQPVAAIGVLSVVLNQLYPVVWRSTPTVPWWQGLTWSVVVTTALAVTGFYVGARRELVVSWQERAERAEREQTEKIAAARAMERTRIAREMHDVLAHRISVVAMHAGALGYRQDLSAEETRRAATVIQENAHEALAELRAILGVLRDTDLESVAMRPQPDLTTVSTLVGEARQAGIPVELTMAVDDPGQVPKELGRNAFRIIQEGITNAAKHAPGSRVAVTVTGCEGQGLVVQVANPASRRQVSIVPGAGLGLHGLRERAELSGGTLSHGFDTHGLFVLEARLRWPARDAGTVEA